MKKKPKTLTLTVKNKTNKKPVNLCIFGSNGAEVVFAKPETDFKPKTYIEGERGCWRCYFQIGIHAYCIGSRQTFKEAKWLLKSLDNSFKNLEKWTKNRK